MSTRSIGPDHTPPPLSVVVATAQPWPELKNTLESLYSQAQGCGAELIVVDAHGHALPANHGYTNLRLLHLPGASLSQCRALGVTEARAEIIAVTEDHCRVAPDWCEQILAAHRDHPRAAAIGGVVDNGAKNSLWDWASVIFAHGVFLPPLQNGERPDISGQANISYKRSALPATFPPHGLEEGELKRALRERGHSIVSDDRMVVSHDLSLSALDTCLMFYNQGKFTAGFRSARLSRAQRRSRALLSPVRFIRTVPDSFRIVARIAVRKPAYRKMAMLSSPLVFVLVCCHVAGQLVGDLRGPGSSAHRLR